MRAVWREVMEEGYLRCPSPAAEALRRKPEKRSSRLEPLGYTPDIREMCMKVAFGVALFLSAVSSFGQKLDVKVTDRQDKEDSYDYVAVYNNTAVGKSFRVHGATFTLVIPDGRLVIVNCDSKFAEHFAGRAGNRRSCRMPLVDEIQAEFKGDDAKLIWPVSLDGKKMQSETYKILAIVKAPTMPLP